MIRRRTITVTEVVCDGCGVTEGVPVVARVPVLPNDWLAKSRPPRVELDEFYGRTVHYCRNCREDVQPTIITAITFEPLGY